MFLKKHLQAGLEFYCPNDKMFSNKFRKVPITMKNI